MTSEAFLSRSRIMLRWLQRLLILALASMAAATSAWACSCGSSLPGGIPQGSFIGASLVARVTMIGFDYVSAPCDKHRRLDCSSRWAGIFWVGDTLKGSSNSMIRIKFDTSMCGGGAPNLFDPTWVAVYGDAEIGHSFGGCTWFGPPPEGDDGPLAQTIAQYRNQLESLKAAVRQHPSDPAALVELAKFLAETHNRLESISTLDQVLAVDPLHREANLSKAEQLALGPDQEAVLDSIEPYVAAHPDDHEAMHRRVLALVRLDRLGETPANWQDFTGICCFNYDFSHRKLNSASFRGNRMDKSSFAASELRRADFSGTNLYAANFRGAILDGADMSGAHLEGADLRGASLKGANLSKTRVGGALYDEATIWPDGFDPVAAGAEIHLQSE
jgi:hypothetical protein